MSEDRDKKREAMRREVEAMVKSAEESHARIKAMDPTDIEAIEQEFEAMERRSEQYKSRLEEMARELMDGTIGLLDKKAADNPVLAQWYEGFATEQENLAREKDKQEGWHEVIE